MIVHHLNCATQCVIGGRLVSGSVSLWQRAPLVSHCLLVETSFIPWTRRKNVSIWTFLVHDFIIQFPTLLFVYMNGVPIPWSLISCVVSNVFGKVLLCVNLRRGKQLSHHAVTESFSICQKLTPWSQLLKKPALPSEIRRSLSCYFAKLCNQSSCAGSGGAM